MTPDENLTNAAATFKQRNTVYGSAYKRHGEVMKALFPNGLAVHSIEEWNRLGVINMLVSKLVRYTSNMSYPAGGHQDSAHDMIAYAAMLEELTNEVQATCLHVPV